MIQVINRLKNIRKQSSLKASYKEKYAFIGIGNHSINNLYPILNYLKVTLKYIVVKSLKNAATINNNFCNIIGTTDYEKVLMDAEINGVFICTNPESHYNLVKKALEKNKNVFVEKPPCLNEDELLDLIKTEEKHVGFCMVGMQKRYAPIIDILKPKLKKGVLTYNYRFLTGQYEEGDKILDIFIHPLDLIYYLFGAYEVISAQSSKNKTFFIHVKHGEILGNIELSTDYSWKSAKESLIINTNTGIYEMQNMALLTFEKKPKLYFKIPVEKILKTTPCLQTLYNTNSFNPTFENNQVYTSGYFTEIQKFLSSCEKEENNNRSKLSGMEQTYKLIKTLQCIEK